MRTQGMMNEEDDSRKVRMEEGEVGGRAYKLKSQHYFSLS